MEAEVGTELLPAAESLGLWTGLSAELSVEECDRRVPRYIPLPRCPPGMV